MADETLENSINNTIEATIGGLTGNGYDEDFYEKLEKFLATLLPPPVTNESQNLEKALNYFAKIINTEIINEYQLNQLPQLKEATYRITDIYSKIIGKPFFEFLKKKGNINHYLNYTNERHLLSFFYSQNPNFSEDRIKYLADYFGKIHIAPYMEGDFKAYGEHIAKPINTGYKHPTVGKNNNYNYYNSLVTPDDAPENTKIAFINEVMRKATELKSFFIIVDLADVIFNKYPEYSNAFMDLFQLHHSKNESLTRTVVNTFINSPLSWYHMDPLKDFLLIQKIESSFKLKWGFAFLQGDFKSWSNSSQNIDYYYQILNQLEKTDNIDHRMYHTELEKVLIEYIFQYKRASDLLKPTYRYHLHLSLILYKTFENIIQYNKTKDKEFLQNLVLKGHEKVNSIKPQYQISDSYIADLFIEYSTTVQDKFPVLSSNIKIVNKIIEIFGNDASHQKLVTQLLLSFYKKDNFMLENKELSKHLVWINSKIKDHQEKLNFYNKLIDLIGQKQGSLSDTQNTKTNLALIRAAAQNVKRTEPTLLAISCRKLISTH